MTIHTGHKTLREILPNTPARRRLVIDLCDELATFGHLSLETVEKELERRGADLPIVGHERLEIFEAVRDFVCQL